MSNLNSPTTESIDVFKEQEHTLVLIDYLGCVRGITAEKVQSALRYFKDNPSLFIFGREVREYLLKSGAGEVLLRKADTLPAYMIQEVRSRIANAMLSIETYKTGEITN